jgi:hypothetical protein
MDILFEIVRTLGAIAGLASAAFLIWDRATKHYPVALFEALPLIDGGSNIEVFVRLKNFSDRPVLLSWPNGQGRGLYIARNDSAEGIMRYLFEGETTIVLSSQAERVFPLLRPSAYSKIDPENMMELEIRWQFAQPIVWRTPRTLRVAIRKRDFEALIEGYVANSQGR